MDVARGDGQRGCFHPAAGEMDRARVVAAHRCFFVLDGHVIFFRELINKFGQFFVIIGAAVDKGESHAASQFRGIVLRLCAGNVGAGRALNYQSQVGLKAFREDPCAAAANLLLHGEA